MDQLVDAYLSLLEGAVRDPSCAISRLTLLGAGERRRILIVFSGLMVAMLALLVLVSLKFLGGRKEAVDSIAVLPFENSANDPGLEIYCLGVPDAVREALPRRPAD